MLAKLAASLIGIAVLAAPSAGAAADAPRPAPSRAAFIGASSVARLPGGLDADERAALLSGDTVSRPLEFDKNGGSYVGGVSYQLVRAVPAEVLAAVMNVPELPNLLPRTRRATRIDGDEQRTRVELEQGNSVASATYTVLLTRQSPGEVRFWLDARRPHGIKDVWGYFRARPFGDQTLVTVAIALDVGPGLVRLLFEDRIQRLALETPRHIKDYVEPRALASR